MKSVKITLSFVLIVALVFVISPVSAVSYQNTYDIDTYSVDQGTLSAGANSDSGTPGWFAFIGYDTLNDMNNCYYMGIELDEYEPDKSVYILNNTDDTECEITLSIGGTEYAHGDIEFHVFSGTAYVHRVLIFWDDFDVDQMIGDSIDPQTFTYELSDPLQKITHSGSKFITTSAADSSGIRGGIFRSTGGRIAGKSFVVSAYSGHWDCDISADYYEQGLSTVTVTTNKYTWINTTTSVDRDWTLYNVYPNWDFNYLDLPIVLKITNPDSGEMFIETIGEGGATNTVNVLSHVWSTGDNSLIAGVQVNYTAVDGSDQVITTFPSGEGTVILDKNKDYYFTATAEGYRSQTNNPDIVAFTANTQHGSYLVPIAENASAGEGTLNFHITTYTQTGSYTPLSGASVTINGQTLLTNDAGFTAIIVNKTASINYVVSKSGYQSVSRIYTPSWPSGYEYIDEWVTLRAEGQTLPGEATAEPTADTRTNQEKAESAFNILFENIELFATMSVVCLFLAFFKWMGW